MKKSKLNNTFFLSNHELLREWNFKKNKISPYDISLGSGKKVWWKCKKGHEWEAVVCDRTLKKSKCPYCNGRMASKDYCLEKMFPLVAKEWNYKKNTIDISKITPKSGKKVWWKCEKGHEWEAVVRHRSNGSGCPYCSGRVATKENSLLYNFPFLCKEWDYKKNDINPLEILPNSHKKVWWKCKKGHEWEAIIKSRTYKNNCPYCEKIELKNGFFCDSLIDAYFILNYEKNEINFKYNDYYDKLNFGNHKFDFLINNNIYVEVTSFDERNNYNQKQYKKYLKTIGLKRDFVQNFLNKKFIFIQKQLSKKELEFVRSNIY
jgi:hypothetical protein